MLEYRKAAGTTDVSVVIRIIDATTGLPETAVEHNTSGIDLEYRREGAASTDITEAALTALTDAHSDGGIEHIGNGYYRLDLPDAACASGVTGVLVHGTITDMVVIGCYIHLEPVPANVTHFGGSAGTFASGIPQASLTASAISSVADGVWDEAASGHVTAGSFGQAHNIIRANTAQAGGNTSITLDASASASDDFYNNARIFITAGTGAGQGRFIEDYNGTTKVATVATWVTNPSSDSVFVILPFGSIPGASAPTAGEVADAVWDEARGDHVTATSFGVLGALALRVNTAQAGTASSITLDASASATNNLYSYNQITIISGTGAGQSRQISAYNGTSKVATVGVNWTTNPSSDSVFVITPLGVDAATVAAIADAVWDEARSGHASAGTFGEYVNADTVRLSGDAGAADNAESFFDGTGYAGTNNVIPTVTTVTNLTNAATAGDFTATMKTSIGTAVAASAVASVTGNVGGNVGGNVTGSVGSVLGAVGSVTAVSAGAITAASLAADTITAAKVAADVGTEIAAAVLTAAASNPIDANLQEINDVALTGDGSVTPFTVA